MIKEYNIADGVKAFSTTRKGGVSTGNYGEFNINEYCGDEAVNINGLVERLVVNILAVVGLISLIEVVGNIHLTVALAERYCRQRSATVAEKRTERRNNNDYRVYDTDAGKRRISDLRDVSYEYAVNYIVKQVYKLCRDRR